jgi:hypothetical protein
MAAEMGDVFLRGVMAEGTGRKRGSDTSTSKPKE